MPHCRRLPSCPSGFHSAAWPLASRSPGPTGRQRMTAARAASTSGTLTRSLGTDRFEGRDEFDILILRRWHPAYQARFRTDQFLLPFQRYGGERLIAAADEATPATAGARNQLPALHPHELIVLGRWSGMTAAPAGLLLLQHHYCSLLRQHLHRRCPDPFASRPAAVRVDSLEQTPGPGPTRMKTG